MNGQQDIIDERLIENRRTCTYLKSHLDISYGFFIACASDNSIPEMGKRFEYSK